MDKEEVIRTASHLFVCPCCKEEIVIQLSLSANSFLNYDDFVLVKRKRTKEEK